ncbi:MAG: MBL fold metallo-hydrolase [Myxococcota bacterium]
MLIFEKGAIGSRINLSFAGFFPGFIITGDKTALVDAGVPPVGPELFKAVKEVLGERPLDFILLTHSHYDHCGCIPYLKRKYPGLKVVGSGTAKKVLTKPEARSFMGKMSREVEDAMDFQQSYPGEDISLDSDLLDVDIVVAEGDTFDLGGGVHFDVYETPGHTRCGLSYFMSPDRALFAGESLGAYAGEDSVLANYLSDYEAYMDSLKKVAALPAEMLGLPHHGMLVGREDVKRYFRNAIEGAGEYRTLVKEYISQGKDEKEMVKLLIERYYHGPAALQPLGAFIVNLRAMIKAAGKS